MKAILYHLGKRYFLVDAGRLFRVFNVESGFIDSTDRNIEPVEIKEVKSTSEIPFGKRAKL